MTKLGAQAKTNSLPANVKKWGQALMAAGWTVLPNVIVQRQRALGLDSIDVNILLYLSTFWWTEDNPPFVSVRAIAEVVGIQPRSVQRRVAALEALGFIRREARFDPLRGQMSNRYLMTPLIEKAEPFAIEELARRAAKRAEAANTRVRKLPQAPPLPPPPPPQLRTVK